MRFFGPCRDIDVDSNTLTGNAGCAVQIENNNNNYFRFVNNTITYNAGGATNSFYPSNILWQNNTVNNNGSNNAQPSSTGTFWNNPPSVSILASAMTATVGVPVDFSAFGFSDASGVSAASYLWDLGDGLPASTSSTAFTYTEPGTYDIGLVVWDSMGRAAHAEVLLTITPAAGASQMADATAVPEPGTFALLIVGASCGLMVCLKTRQRSWM